MFWLYNLFFSTYPRRRERKVWVKVKMRHETDKAILVLNQGVKAWIPKSRIKGVKFKKGEFWVRVAGCRY